MGDRVVVLAGGTGGAKLARGMLDVVGAKRLTVIANTGDDIEIYGAHVSPDPDLICFWLADSIDERGWGLRGDTFNVMEALRALGDDVWFNLGDRDLAWCLQRTRMEQGGLTPTAALRELSGKVGVKAQVLPMCDSRLRTFVNGMSLQEFMILAGGRGPVTEVRFETESPVEVSSAVLGALDSAECVIVGPSNPVISIWPIITALGDALTRCEAPVVCVSPVVAGEIVKGPTAAFLDAYRHPVSAAGVAAFYESVAPCLIDGIIADEEVVVDEEALPRARGGGGARKLATLRADTLMSDPARRVALAERTLTFAQSLATTRRK